MSHVGFVNCDKYIVELEILGMKNSTDKHAMFSTPKARVVEIFNFDGSVANVLEIEKGESLYNTIEQFYSFIEHNLNYFLSFEEAQFYRDKPENYTGEWKGWYKNGQLSYKVKYENGFWKGPYRRWFDNGKLLFQIE